MAARFVDFQVLKECVQIDDIFPLIDFHPTKRGDQWRGPCTVCEGNARSLVVTGSKQVWYCFGCKKGGDLIALVAHFTGAGAQEAAIQIAEFKGVLSGTSSSNGTGPDTVPKAQAGKETKKLQPLAYLEPGHESVERLGVALETAMAFGAGYAPKGILRGRMAIPVHNRHGELVAYCGRAVAKEQQPTLLFPKGFDPSEHIFNAHQIGAGELYLVADPLDVLTAQQNGVENCVAFLTQEIMPQQLEMLASLMDEIRCEVALLA